MKSLSQTFLISILVATFFLIFSSPKVESSTTIVEKQYITATDSERIQLFINELLTPKSASCFRKILNAESHFNPNAKNPFSSASGVGQLLDSTYKTLGLRKTVDPLGQVVASLAHISRRFGGANSVCNAWQSERTQHSY